MSIEPKVLRIVAMLHRPAILPLLCAAALAVSACAQSIAPPLPDLSRTTADSMMTPAQQQKAIQDLGAKKSAEEADATKKIEASR